MKTIPKKAPMEPRKPDTRCNPDGVVEKLNEAQQRDRRMNKKPIRVNKYTVVLKSNNITL